MARYYVTEEGVRDITELLNKTDETIRLLTDTVKLLKNALDKKDDELLRENSGIKAGLESVKANLEAAQEAIKADNSEKMRKSLIFITQEFEKSRAGSEIALNQLSENHAQSISSLLEALYNSLRSLKIKNTGNADIKPMLKELSERVAVSADIGVMIEKLERLEKGVTVIKAGKHPAWLKKQSVKAAKRVRETSDTLGELAVARILAAGSMDYTEIMKKSPVSAEKTRKILNRLSGEKKVAKKRKGRAAVYSLK